MSVSGGTRNLIRVLVGAVLVALAGAGYLTWKKNEGHAGASRYRTEPVTMGEVVQTVSANGTVNPVNLVNVGTQVSGTIQKIHVDFNDRVKKGQVLAELDPRLLSAQLAQDQANAVAASATLKLAQANYDRMRQLYQQDYVARADLDQAQQALESAQAQLALARAQVERDRTNLGYTVIRSPVSGVVVSRQVNVGQTVAASFQTPTLFQIAQDLRQMQIDTNVAEADVGRIRVGQEARFYVDAFPEKSFIGRVEQIRINPTVQQNVVTYDVVISAANPQELLMPGMTAYVGIVTARRERVARIPNGALRFRPEGQVPEKSVGGGKEAHKAPGAATVYRLEGERIVPVPVRVGISDNRYSELLQGELRPGDLLVIGTREAEGGSRSGFRFRLF